MKTTTQAIFGLAMLASGVVAAPGKDGAMATQYLVYVGTYTGPQSKGIYSFRFNTRTGTFTEPQVAAETGNPSWLAIHPNGRFLYAANEYNGAKDSVSAFRIDPSSGKLTLLNTIPSGGASTCHISVDRGGKFALLAHYGTGSVSVRRINDDGSLGERTSFVQHTGSSVDPKRQRKPWAHAIYLSPDNRFVLVPDLGIDKVLVYRFDAAQGVLEPNDPPFAEIKGGSGPRHLDFHPNRKFAYLISEMAGTVTSFAWDAARGSLGELQTINILPTGFDGEIHSAEVQVSPNGRFLYASNRGPETIGVFSIASKGTLTAVEQVPSGGVMPRGFALDPTGAYLFAANQKSDYIVLFRVDRKTGRLNPSGQKLNIGAPVCVTFLPLE